MKKNNNLKLKTEYIYVIYLDPFQNWFDIDQTNLSINAFLKANTNTCPLGVFGVVRVVN